MQKHSFIVGATEKLGSGGAATKKNFTIDQYEKQRAYA